MSLFRIRAQAEVGLTRIVRVLPARNEEHALLLVAATLQDAGYYVVSIEGV